MAATPQTTNPSAPATINHTETNIWRYMRLSGLLILPLVFGHLIIMHLVEGVHEMSYEWVIVERWAYLGWRIYDAFLLWFAGTHAFFGIRNILTDYVHNPRTKRAIVIVMAVVMAFLFALGTIAIIAAPEIPEVVDDTSAIFQWLTRAV